MYIKEKQTIQSSIDRHGVINTIDVIVINSV